MTSFLQRCNQWRRVMWWWYTRSLSWMWDLSASCSAPLLSSCTLERSEHHSIYEFKLMKVYRPQLTKLKHERERQAASSLRKQIFVMLSQYVSLCFKPADHLWFIMMIYSLYFVIWFLSQLGSLFLPVPASMRQKSGANESKSLLFVAICFKRASSQRFICGS